MQGFEIHFQINQTIMASAAQKGAIESKANRDNAHDKHYSQAH